jgi:hypothetical protein
MIPDDTPKYFIVVTLVAGLEKMKLPLLQPSTAAVIGYIRPQPTNIAAHFSQPPHSPLTSLVDKAGPETSSYAPCA